MSRTFTRLSASKTALAMIRESSLLIWCRSSAACLPCVLCASNTASEISLFRCVSFGIWHPYRLRHSSSAFSLDHQFLDSLGVRRERPRRCCAAEKRDELASSYVEHGLLPGTRCASLPQAQDAPEAPAGPWGDLNRSESTRQLACPRLSLPPFANAAIAASRVGSSPRRA